MKYLNLIKEYLGLIIIAPATLGGLYQVIMICILLGVPYLRFFSVTQVLPDGLLVLWIALWLIIIGCIFKCIFKKFFVNKKENLSLCEEIIKTLSYLFIVCISTYYFLYPYSQNQVLTINDILIQYFVFIITLCFIIIIIQSFLNCLSFRFTKIKSHLSNFFNRHLDSFSLIFTILSLILLIFFIPQELSKINTAILYTFKPYNINIYEKKIIKKYNLKQSPKFIYFNKDYVFYELELNEKRILIIDTKNLTDMSEKE